MATDYLSKLIREIYRLTTGKRKPCQTLNYIKYLRNKKNSMWVTYKPVRLGIFTSYECNLNCTMCLTHGRTVPDNPYKYRGAKQMSLSMFKDIITKLPEALILSFIGNGEPLLNKNLFKMIRYGKKIGKMHTTLCSNGLILDNFIEEVISGNLDNINISVNAHNYKNYKYFTGMPLEVYQRIFSNTQKLVKERNRKNGDLKITISLIVGRKNYKEIPGMIAFAEDLGVDSVGLCNVMPTSAEDWGAEMISLYKTPKVVNFIKGKKKKEYKIKVHWPILLEKDRNNRTCKDSWYSMSVDGDGDVNACERQCLNSRGNGKYWEKDVFNNQHFRNWRRIFLSKKLSLPKPCETCYNNMPK